MRNKFGAGMDEQRFTRRLEKLKKKNTPEYCGELQAIADDFLLARDVLDQCELNWRNLANCKKAFARHKEWKRNMTLSGLELSAAIEEMTTQDDPIFSGHSLSDEEKMAFILRIGMLQLQRAVHNVRVDNVEETRALKLLVVAFTKLSKHEHKLECDKDQKESLEHLKRLLTDDTYSNDVIRSIPVSEYSETNFMAKLMKRAKGRGDVDSDSSGADDIEYESDDELGLGLCDMDDVLLDGEDENGESKARLLEMLNKGG